MARPKSTDLEREKAALKAQLARCRRDGADALNGLGSGLGNALDLPRQLRASFRKNGWRWIAGAIATGAAVGMLLFRKGSGKIAKPNKGAIASFLIAPLAKQAYSIFKPNLGNFARKQLKKWFKDSDDLGL